jgi:hypothetical protein
VERNDSLEDFRITNTIEDFRRHRDFERRSPTEPGNQDPFWSESVFRRALFSPDSPVVSEISPPVISEISSTETVPVTPAYRFTVPSEMAHLANTTSVPTGFTAANIAPINTQRMPNVTLTLPPRYHALNALFNASIPTPPQTPSGSPGGLPFPRHPIPGFIPTLPQFPSGNPNPSGTIPSITPNLQILVGGQGGTIQFPFIGRNPITTQPLVGTQPMIGGPTLPFGQNIPLELA